MHWPFQSLAKIKCTGSPWWLNTGTNSFSLTNFIVFIYSSGPLTVWRHTPMSPQPWFCFWLSLLQTFLVDAFSFFGQLLTLSVVNFLRQLANRCSYIPQWKHKCCNLTYWTFHGQSHSRYPSLSGLVWNTSSHTQANLSRDAISMVLSTFNVYLILFPALLRDLWVW